MSKWYIQQSCDKMRNVDLVRLLPLLLKENALAVFTFKTVGGYICLCRGIIVKMIYPKGVELWIVHQAPNVLSYQLV